MGLHGILVEVSSLSESKKVEMFQLMEQFYDDTALSVFLRDLNEKNYCILLYDESHLLKGFSTQQLISVIAEGKKIHGVFSGDTIIHKDNWGSFELFKIFAQNFILMGKQYPEFYWILISKGYKTYRMLPVFFQRYYPNCQKVTPRYEQSILDAFGRTKYPGEYDEASGVITYRETKDKLKAGVADITSNRLRDIHIQHFIKMNPGYYKGNDLVCMARLTEVNLKPAVGRLLLGKNEDD